MITLFRISPKVKSQKRPYILSTETSACIGAHVFCPSSVTRGCHCSCLQMTPSTDALDPSQHHLLKAFDPPTIPFPISSFLPSLLDHSHQQTKRKAKNPSLHPKSLPRGTVLFPCFPLQSNSSKELSVIHVSTFPPSIFSEIHYIKNSASTKL